MTSVFVSVMIRYVSPVFTKNNYFAPFFSPNSLLQPNLLDEMFFFLIHPEIFF